MCHKNIIHSLGRGNMNENGILIFAQHIVITKAEGVGEVGVHTHAGGHGKGLVAEECRQRCAQGCGQTGRGQHAGSVHPGRGKKDGIQENDVGHCHERGQTCPNLRVEGCAIFFEFEQFFHKMSFLVKK